MITALNVIKARVAGEQRGFSGIFNPITDDLSDVDALRVGGVTFNRVKANGDDIYFTALKNGVAVLIYVVDLGNDYSFRVHACRRLASNGKPHVDFDEDTVELGRVKTSVKLDVNDEDRDIEGDVGFDTRLADKFVAAAIERMEALDRLVGSAHRSIRLAGGPEVPRLSEKQLDSDNGNMVGYESATTYVSLGLVVRGKTDFIEVDYSIDDVILKDGSVSRLRDTMTLKLSSIKDFDHIMSLIDRNIKKRGVEEVGLRVFKYSFTGQDQKSVPLVDKAAFERELKSLINKHKLTINKPVKK